MELKLQLDNIIRVDRSVRPSYPGWVKMVMHPELENTGPVEYNIFAVERCFHESQKVMSVEHDAGIKIYTHLRDTNMLNTCLGLRDLEEIQKKGIVFFQKHFHGDFCVGWKSIAQDIDGNLSVPYLYGHSNGVGIMWAWMGSSFCLSSPALRFSQVSSKN